jgi:hypothetical protein
MPLQPDPSDRSAIGTTTDGNRESENDQTERQPQCGLHTRVREARQGPNQVITASR